ncbi:hypothetical protein GOARA_029_00220 [Gordonia araii NBRC 100433]|uniref:Uncharacterized protein n=1 Tax=Gordonia araii NBRC 100433 TaxID=1073574 RepID=G7GZY3_9ACTN|nr:hypothetical protein GOARA_029_00220 [Gordonia araii NBRC 100433]
MTAEQIREVINTLRKGKNRGVYVVPSEEEIQSLYDRLSRGGVEITPDSGYYKNGHMVRLPDGTTVGYRPESGSGGATLDVVYPNGRKAKVHVE